MVAIRRTTKAIVPPSRPPNSGGTSDRTHLGMCHALGTARFLIFMLVGETDRNSGAPSTIARDGAPAFLSETGAGCHYRKDGAHRAPWGSGWGEDISPGAPRSRPACWSRARATFTAAVMSTQQPAPPPWLRRYLARRGSSAPSSRGRAVVEIHDFAKRVSYIKLLLGWLGDLDSNQDCSVQSREFYR